MSGNLYNWIANYLTERKQFTVINNVSSDTTPILFGVPQGSLFGPRLFGVHVNDLPDISEDCETYLFADDSAFRIQLTIC